MAKRVSRFALKGLGAAKKRHTMIKANSVFEQPKRTKKRRHKPKEKLLPEDNITLPEDRIKFQD